MKNILTKATLLPFLSAAFFSLQTAYSSDVCVRTAEVRKAIEAALEMPCEEITYDELEKIASLTISNSSKIETSDLDGLYNLKRFSFTNNFTPTLPPDLLTGFEDLETIIIEKNTLTDLPKEFFKGLYNLKVIKINTNYLQTLPMGIFEDQENLITLSLKNNIIKNLPDALFETLFNLQSLDISENRLRTLSDDLLLGLENLINLDLSKNNISNLPQVIFDNIPSIKRINLDKNRLQNVPDGLFVYNEDLTTLSLRNNILTEADKERIEESIYKEDAQVLY